jgi:hypothetical protein
MDPSPFRERDLSRDAEEYIVDSTRELPSRAPSGLLIHLDRSAVADDEGRILGDAVRVHFARRSRILSQRLRRLLKRGWVSFCIGLGFLATFFFIAQSASRLMGENGVARLLNEGLLIGGWVAMWRPLEIFLYDWWPIWGERRVYDRLSRIPVEVVCRKPAATATPSQVSPEARKALGRWENEGGRVPGTRERARG